MFVEAGKLRMDETLHTQWLKLSICVCRKKKNWIVHLGCGVDKKLLEK